MPSRPTFTNAQVWSMSVVLGLFGSLVGLLLLLAVYAVFRI